jgi:hypothetical protein
VLCFFIFAKCSAKGGDCSNCRQAQGDNGRILIDRNIVVIVFGVHNQRWDTKQEYEKSAYQSARIENTHTTTFFLKNEESFFWHCNACMRNHKRVEIKKAVNIFSPLSIDLLSIFIE